MDFIVKFTLTKALWKWIFISIMILPNSWTNTSKLKKLSVSCVSKCININIRQTLMCINSWQLPRIPLCSSNMIMWLYCHYRKCHIPCTTTHTLSPIMFYESGPRFCYCSIDGNLTLSHTNDNASIDWRKTYCSVDGNLTLAHTNDNASIERRKLSCNGDIIVLLFSTNNVS